MKSLTPYKNMEQQIDWDKIIGVGCAVAGGMITFLKVEFLDASFLVSLIKAGSTAIVCGFMGVAGKHCFTLLKNKWKKRQDKKKNQRNNHLNP